MNTCEHKKDISSSKIKTGCLLALTACFMLFLYAPLELLFTNQEEFFFDMYILLPPIICNFLFFFLLSIGLFFVVRKSKLYYVILAAYFIAFICSYIQGNFLAEWLPIINGDIICWDEFPLERVKSIVLWIFITVCVYFIFKRKGKIFFEKIVQVSSVCMGLMLLMTIIILCISTGSYHKKQIFSTATAKNILTMSEDRNFIILVLDAVDSAVLNQIIEGNTRYEELFTDFTYYTNAMGGYPYTVHSVPLILTGRWFEKQCDFEEFSKQAYADSPLFSCLEDEGYRMGIYETDFTLGENGNRFDNILDCKRSIKSWPTFCRWQIQMTGYRYAPFDLKRFCYVYTNAFNTLKVMPDNEELFDYDDRFFYDKLCNDEIELVTSKCFRFIHVEGAHAPYRYDEDMKATETGNYEDSVKASMKLTEAYISKLKEKGVYDNSCIIVMADHGHGTGFNDNPILFIKGFNEHHEMKRDDAPISYDDLQEAYARLLNEKESGELFDYHEGDYRERRFLFQDDDNNPLEIMEEYVQKGHAGDWDTLLKVKEF